MFCLDFAVGRGHFHLSTLVDQEVEGCLLWARVLTNKPKFERCALTPQGKKAVKFSDKVDKTPLQEELVKVHH